MDKITVLFLIVVALLAVALFAINKHENIILREFDLQLLVDETMDGVSVKYSIATYVQILMDEPEIGECYTADEVRVAVEVYLSNMYNGVSHE